MIVAKPAPNIPISRLKIKKGIQNDINYISDYNYRSSTFGIAFTTHYCGKIIGQHQKDNETYRQKEIGPYNAGIYSNTHHFTNEFNKRNRQRRRDNSNNQYQDYTMNRNIIRSVVMLCTQFIGNKNIDRTVYAVTNLIGGINHICYYPSPTRAENPIPLIQ